MSPRSPPPARWLCLLAGALACALRPAVSVRRATQSPGCWGWSGGGESSAVCAHVYVRGISTEHRVLPPGSAWDRM